MSDEAKTMRDQGDTLERVKRELAESQTALATVTRERDELKAAATKKKGIFD